MQIIIINIIHLNKKIIKLQPLKITNCLLNKKYKKSNHMKNLILILTILTFGFNSTFAQWGGGNKKVKGNKNVITKTIDTESYDGLLVAGSFDVILEKGTEGKITIEGEENIVAHIQIEVEQNTLKIKTEKGYNLYTNKKLSITVPFEIINSVQLTGSGSITANDKIESDDFRVKLSGSGDIDLKIDADNVMGSVTGSGDIDLEGTTSDLNVKVTGSGDFDAANLDADNTVVSVTGSGDAKVVAKKSINAKVTGSGDVEYSGNPSDVKVKTSGSGDIESR